MLSQQSVGLVTGRLQVRIQDWKIICGTILKVSAPRAVHVFRMRHKTEVPNQLFTSVNMFKETISFLNKVNAYGSEEYSTYVHLFLDIMTKMFKLVFTELHTPECDLII